MSASNFRNRQPNTVHHLTSRIAHRVYFLGDDERNDFVQIVRRAAEFCGIRLLAWCVMTNHFHLMVHLPVPEPVADEEVLRRYGVLKGAVGRAAAERQLAEWRKSGETGERRAREWLDAQRRRMNDVGTFMKIVKQWFTEDYNRRHSHVGTLWEAAYHDAPVSGTVADMSRRMGYVHLNPIRAAAADAYDGYAWCSFAAAAKGDRLALDGMRFVYDDLTSSDEELLRNHVALLDGLLQAEKRRRAEEIARKRANGYAVPPDRLTDEAMVAQAAAHLEEVRKASEEMHAADDGIRKRKERLLADERRVLDFARLHPNFGAEAIAESLGLSRAGAYRHLKALRARKELDRVKGAWIAREFREI